MPHKPFATLYVCLGSNQPTPTQSKRHFLEQACRMLTQSVGTLVAASSVYQTQAWGKSSAPDYLNQVLQLNTLYSPRQVLEKCLQTEESLGRVRRQLWEDRVIDIDILYYGQEIIIEKGLEIPHPYIRERAFVLMPMQEIAADFVHPVYQKTQKELWQACPKDLSVTLYNA